MRGAEWSRAGAVSLDWERCLEGEQGEASMHDYCLGGFHSTRAGGCARKLIGEVV